MRITNYLLLVWLSILAEACHHGTPVLTPEQCIPWAGEFYGATADSLTGGIPVASAGSLVDTEKMLEPDPAIRTYDHLYGLRNRLRRFREANSQLPKHIEEFSPPDVPGIKFNVDGWGSSIHYTRLSGEEYELRAPGPDHRLCTLDDMIVRNDSLPERPSRS